MSEAAATPASAATAPRYLVDVNVWLRAAQPAHALHTVASGALRALLVSGAALYSVPQTAYEFWAVATRPATVNGLGWTPAQAAAEITRLQSACILLSETPDVYAQWRRLVAAHGVSGVAAHDARLVAAMQVHGLTHILTFDADDFRRYAAAPPQGEGITIINPASVPRLVPR